MMRSFDPYSGVVCRDDDDFVYINGRAYPRAFNSTIIYDRESHPYSYSFHVIAGEVRKFEHPEFTGHYSDRIQQANYEKYRNALAIAGVGGNWARASLKQASDFLSVYYGKDLECVQILEGCNVSNGYPLWYFLWRNPE